APIDVGKNILGIKLKGLGIVSDGLVVLLQLIVCIAPVIVGSRILGIEGEGLAKVSDGLVVLLHNIGRKAREYPLFLISMSARGRETRGNLYSVFYPSSAVDTYLYRHNCF